MTGLLCTSHFLSDFEPEVRAAAARGGIDLELILAPDTPEARLDAETVAKIDIAFFSGDVVSRGVGRGFFAAVQGAPNLTWMHVFNAGIDNPVFARVLAKGVRISTSSGSTAVPIAQSVITGLLMLSRGFPKYLEAQRRKAWLVQPDETHPRDLDGQTLTVLGLGAIGSEVARLGHELGLHTIGIRRSPRKPDDTVDELVLPAELANVLPRTDWLAITAPLTDETRRLVDAAAIASMPRGSHILNIGRGEVVDEQAMIAALESGHLAGAYLDVFEVEPLPQESPLWTMPNVVISPHSSGISQGNERRAAGYFLKNLEAWGKGEALVNDATPAR